MVICTAVVTQQNFTTNAELNVNYSAIHRNGIIHYTTITRVRVVYLVYTSKAWGRSLEGWGCIYQESHECPCYNYYIPLSCRLQTGVSCRFGLNVYVPRIHLVVSLYSEIHQICISTFTFDPPTQWYIYVL